jgi:hypothetical protein
VIQVFQCQFDIALGTPGSVLETIPVTTSLDVMWVLCGAGATLASTYCVAWTEKKGNK